ncbi:hypothetical protein JB92DRAFT_3118690 [Gautieria morchelliformis]|nr:hypothetical protein JB92DRAFT_3118690 [Gautieria morchelliformis]
MSSPPALANWPYQALFFWGVLGIFILIAAALFVCTPFGHLLKRRLLRVGRTKDTERSGQYQPELQAHTIEFRSPIGTPAPPYEWVLRITPPPLPTAAHLSSAVAHVPPTLTHRYSDISRVASEYGLGIQMTKDGAGETHITETREETADALDYGNSAPICTETNPGVLLSEPVQDSPGRPLSAAEIGNAEGPEATGESECQATQDRSRVILLQSDERATAASHVYA